MKPIDELLGAARGLPINVVAAKLCCEQGFVLSWFPKDRTTKDGRRIIESGWEPSAGFIAAALALLRQ